MKSNQQKAKSNNSFLLKDNNALPYRLNSVKGIRKTDFPFLQRNINNNYNKNINISNSNINNDQNIGQKTFEFDDITFTSDFNSGNIKDCRKIKEDEFSLLISLDCEGKILSTSISNYKIWFYFGVISKKEKKITISIDNMNNFYKIFKNGYKIAYLELKEGVTPSDFQKTYNENEENDWKRLDIQYFISLDEKTNLLTIKSNYTLPENKWVLFSYCFPWSYEKNEAFLNYIKENYMNKFNESNIYYNDDILTLSKEKRKIHLLTITSNKNINFSKKEQTLAGIFPYKNKCNLMMHDKHIIFITARVHPGETPGTLVFNGILKTLINTENPINKILLDNFIFKLIPIINVDGVSNGYFRLDQDGFNLNRCYLNPNQKINPENFAITKLFYFYANNFKVRYYFDLHADMNTRGVYTFGNALKSFEEHVENVLFSFIFKINSPHVDFSHCIFTEKSMGSRYRNDMAGKEATSRVQFYQKTGLIHTYTVESSYFKGVFNKDNIENEKSSIYLIKDFEETGCDLLKSILDYEELLLSDNLLRSDYQSIPGCRKHIAQLVKFNEDRFRFNYNLRDFITNIEEQKKWISVKEINEAREKFILKKEMNKNKKIANNNSKANIGNRLNRNKTIGTKIVNWEIKLNNKTNRNAFRNNKTIIYPLKNNSNKNINEHKEIKLHIPFSTMTKKDINFDIVNNTKTFKKILRPIKNI